MAKSSYEYARNAQAKGETEERAAARKAVIEASGASGVFCQDDVSKMVTNI